MGLPTKESIRPLTLDVSFEFFFFFGFMLLQVGQVRLKLPASHNGCFTQKEAKVRGFYHLTTNLDHF